VGIFILLLILLFMMWLIARWMIEIGTSMCINYEVLAIAIVICIVFLVLVVIFFAAAPWLE